MKNLFSCIDRILFSRSAVNVYLIGFLCAGSGWVFSRYQNVAVWPAVLHGILIGSPILLFERGHILPKLLYKLRRSSSPIFLFASLVGMTASAIMGNIAAEVILNYFWRQQNPQSILPDHITLIYSIAVSAIIITFLRVRDIVGSKVLWNLFIGRYHRPVREDRVFMFLDLVGSTHFAQNHGDLAALDLINRVFAELAGPVRRFGGEIDDYVGDMAIVTWPLDRGVRHSAVIHCLLDFLKSIEADSDRWIRRFGQVPRFRAAIHCGSVLTAEIGVERHKIIYYGDVMNTTSRLESVAKELGVHIVISEHLLNQLPFIPDDLALTNIGSRLLRGRDEPIALFSLHLRYKASSATT